MISCSKSTSRISEKEEKEEEEENEVLVEERGSYGSCGQRDAGTRSRKLPSHPLVFLSSFMFATISV